MKAKEDSNKGWTRDEVLWKKNAWPLAPNFFDGSFPELRVMARMTDKDIEEGYLAAVEENRKREATKEGPYFAGTAVLFRGEMWRRLESEHVTPTDKENTKAAITWCVKQWKSRRPRPEKKALAREAVVAFLPHLEGYVRENKVNSVRTAFSKKL